MSVIGIDFGNESCYVATAKAGGIETLANDYSMRATPSCVAFDGRKRILGVGAKNQLVTNMKNTICGFKHLLGRKFNDPQVQQEIKNIPIRTEERPDNKLGIIVNYLGKEQSFTPEQLTAMLFTKLKETSAHAMQTQVNDCVIACPVFFTNTERMALLEAAEIAGLNVLRLMNETTATALAYGFYKQELLDDKSRNVIFVDCGQSSLQVSAVVFNKGRLRMLASTWDQIGGRDFDRVMAEHFAKRFESQYKINVRNNPRAMLRLLTECEKLKRQMSANSTPLPLNIECFVDDVDVSSIMQRSELEELCKPYLQRVESTFRQLLEQCKLDVSQIDSVEIVGGTSRVPAIKQLIEVVFGKPPSTTLNQDESVSRGAALQCAIMSPAVRVRDFAVTDVQNYAAKVCWESDGFLQAGEIVVFPKYHAAPFSRLLTLNRKVPFTLTVQYAEEVPLMDPVIGKWHINLKPNENFDYQVVKIKVRINQHGIVYIAGASVERPEQLEQQTVDQTETNETTTEEIYENEDVAINTATSASSPGGHGWAQRVMGWFSSADKKKKSNKALELPVDCETQGWSSVDDLKKFVQQEIDMLEDDAKEILRVDAKNALEEFIYDSRNKIQGSMSRYLTEKERTDICGELEVLENWLYEDGEDVEREAYTEKHQTLQERIAPIGKRQAQFQQIPASLAQLEKTIQAGLVTLEEYKKGSPKYAHITEMQALELSAALDRAKEWQHKNLELFRQAQPTMDAQLDFGALEAEVKTLQSAYDKFLNGSIENSYEQINGTANKDTKQQPPKDEPNVID